MWQMDYTGSFRKGLYSPKFHLRYNLDHQVPTCLQNRNFKFMWEFVSTTIWQQRLLSQRCLQHDKIHSSSVLNKVTPFWNCYLMFSWLRNANFISTPFQICWMYFLISLPLTTSKYSHCYESTIRTTQSRKR